MKKRVTKKGVIMLYQQGDVLLKTVSSIPEKAKAKKNLVLAEGETTGHAHVAETGTVFVDVDGSLFMNCSEETTIQHEEHKPITVPPGKYKVEIVQEYDHFAEEARRVVD